MLQIRDLLKIYPGPVTALKGVSLDIPNGLFGLLSSFSENFAFFLIMRLHWSLIRTIAVMSALGVIAQLSL